MNKRNLKRINTLLNAIELEIEKQNIESDWHDRQYCELVNLKCALNDVYISQTQIPA